MLVRAEESWLKIWIRLCQHRNWCPNWIVEGFARDHFVEFSSSTPQSNQNILSDPLQVFIPAVSHMKIANVFVETIHRNVRIALQFSYQFEIFISVCNFSYQFAILTFQCIVPTWTFAIFIWVCNFHMSLQFSYQFAILMSQLQHLLTWLCMDSMSLWHWTH
jgi:hypothetical protein